MSDERPSIARRRVTLDSAHRERVRELTKEIQDQYHKDIQALVVECGLAGHVKGRWEDNGWGTSWCRCSRCGGRIPETVKTDMTETSELIP